MTKTPKTPLWVFLAFSAIETRRAALILIFSCVIFTLYSIPWTLLVKPELAESLSKIFLIEDWSWAGMMLPICLWYLASLIWMDKNGGWIRRPAGLDAEQ